MASNDIVSRLNDLIQLDVDAVHAYEQAIERIDVPQISQDLETFKSDHERHIENLSGVVRGLGGEPPERSRDFKGFLIEGFTALRSVTGTEGALEAMRTNEKTTNEKYEQALDGSLPADVEQVVRSNREDERRHLAYIENALQNRSWETAGARPSV